jgi:tetratricopeptide (TPR) repeat protein
MPDNESSRVELAQSRQLVIANKSAGQQAEAQHIEAMLPAVRRSLASDPDNPRRQRDLATGLQRLAELRIDKDPAHDVLPMIDEAVRLEESLLEDDPANTIVQDDLARALGTLGVAKERVGKLAGAVGAHERSVALRRKLMDVQGGAAASWRLAVGLEQLAGAYENAGRHAEAIPAADEAADLLEQRMAAQPDDANRAALVQALDLLANAFAAAGRPQDADAARERRQKYNEPPASSPTAAPASAPAAVSK